jgi:hypothetical protein
MALQAVACDALRRTEVAISGRDEPVTVLTAEDPTVLASLLDPYEAAPDDELQIA